jgi:hypothetical protein
MAIPARISVTSHGTSERRRAKLFVARYAAQRPVSGCCIRHLLRPRSEEFAFALSQRTSDASALTNLPCSSVSPRRRLRLGAIGCRMGTRGGASAPVMRPKQANRVRARRAPDSQERPCHSDRNIRWQLIQRPLQSSLQDFEYLAFVDLYLELPAILGGDRAAVEHVVFEDTFDLH